MAKVKAAFFGLGASKSLGGAITFYKRKGIQCVREKVTPANPNTSSQQTQRTQFQEGVDQWHDTKLLAVDKTAWNKRATIVGGGQSGFNQMISNVRSYATTNDHTLLYNLKMTLTGGAVQPKITGDAAGNCEFRIIRGPHAGYSESKALVADVERLFTSVAINAGDVCVFVMTAAGKLAESGYFACVPI